MGGGRAGVESLTFGETIEKEDKTRMGRLWDQIVEKAEVLEGPGGKKRMSDMIYDRKWSWE